MCGREHHEGTPAWERRRCTVAPLARQRGLYMTWDLRCSLKARNVQFPPLEVGGVLTFISRGRCGRDGAQSRQVVESLFRP